ncbi:MAG: gliding motility lipoprotein GldH [Bacteroidia bacterium]|nr:gliding motility lipoprotein GldH [Sphingobacteriaceae bacterium]MBK7309224.1 gliding motility lipoprotein GldH [Sphingobacteriaceae bacterium]MBK7818634.1 gliding motility lipoprotein GldH [Sphingobacteriaceae bacterium]MBP9068193.1 gliding motility lipoprotein GldH [Bacteroidia bacterium]
MTRPRNIVFVFVIFLSILFTSCNKNVIYTEYRKFNENEWYAKDKAVFDVDVKDNTSLNNISLMVRHADAYPYSNIFLFLETTYPDGKVEKDTLEVILANGKGEWMGSGAGDIFDFKVPIKKNVKFPMTGTYKFAFQQAMRTDPLPLVMDFGFEIEKSN